MAFKEVLLPLNSYPEATPTSSIDRAVEFAALLGARISALVCETELRVPGNALGQMLLDIPGIIAAERAKGARNAQELVGAFEASAASRGLAHRHSIDRAIAAAIPDMVAEYARLHDLTILPMDTRRDFERHVAECVIFGSGRPNLILPAQPRRTGALRLDTIGIAWDFSRPAARAVADAVPLLRRARSVHIVTFRNEKAMPARRSGADVVRHLAAHDVQAGLREEDAGGRPIGRALEEYAAAHGLDLLVMGAYGHSRLRDFVLGGATKSIVADPPLPVFLSH